MAAMLNSHKKSARGVLIQSDEKSLIETTRVYITTMYIPCIYTSYIYIYTQKKKTYTHEEQTGNKDVTEHCRTLMVMPSRNSG